MAMLLIKKKQLKWHIFSKNKKKHFFIVYIICVPIGLLNALWCVFVSALLELNNNSDNNRKKQREKHRAVVRRLIFAANVNNVYKCSAFGSYRNLIFLLLSCACSCHCFILVFLFWFNSDALLSLGSYHDAAAMIFRFFFWLGLVWFLSSKHFFILTRFVYNVHESK